MTVVRKYPCVRMEGYEWCEVVKTWHGLDVMKKKKDALDLEVSPGGV